MRKYNFKRILTSFSLLMLSVVDLAVHLVKLMYIQLNVFSKCSQRVFTYS